MDKKVYLKNRFKKDFIRYSLLQEDSITAAEIAETLYGVLSINDILYNGKQQIEFICNEQLSFEKVKNEEWMVENGLLVDGELKVFVGEVHSVNKLFHMLCMNL